MRDLKYWVNGVVGGFQVRAGRSLEEMVAGTLRVAFEMKDVDPATIRLRQKIVDTAGRMGPPGRSYEYDLFASNGETWVFEIKAVANREAIERFSDKADLAAAELGLAGVRKAVITLDKSDDVVDACREHGILLG
jgi:hypothetical protein